MMVTLCDRQSLYSIREDDVAVAGTVDVLATTVIVIVIDPPPGQVNVRDRVRPSPAAVITMLVACVRVAPTAPCAAAGLIPVEGVNDEGADGVLPPHPDARPSAMTTAPNRCTRMEVPF